MYPSVAVWWNGGANFGVDVLDGVRAGPGEREDLACMVPERDMGILSNQIVSEV